MYSRRSRGLLAVCLVCGILTPAAVIAQKPRPPGKSGAKADANTTEAANSAEAKPADAWERLIYLPYKNLKGVFEKHGATVFLPYLEYLKLWERSLGGMRPIPAGPPVSAVITESHYVARIEKDLARIDATLTVQVLGKPWAQVPLRFGDVAVGKVTGANNPATPGPATPGDEKVLLRGIGEGTYSLLLPAKGAHTVQLELVSRIRTTPDGRSFVLQCPPVGITTFELLIPEADQTVEIKPHWVSLPVAAAEKETRVKASLGSTPSIAVNWHPRAGVRPEMDLLTSVTNRLQVSVAEGQIHTDALLQYEVLRGELNEVRIAVPLGHRILDVSAPEAKIEGWKAVAEEKRQVVTVKLFAGAQKKLAIEVHTERSLTQEAFFAAGIDEEETVHGIHAVEAVRESGLLVLTHGKDLSLTAERQQGLIRIDASDVEKSLHRPGALYYRFYSPRFQLKLAARPVEPRLIAQQQTNLVFREDELRLEADLTYKVERAGVFAISIRLPEDLTVDNVVAEGMSEFTVDEKAHTLAIALTEKRQGAIKVSVRGHRDLDEQAGESEQQLPLLEPTGAVRETGRVFVYAPAAIEVVTGEEKLVGAHPEPASGTPPVPNVRLVSAWTYNRRPVEIWVKTVRKPTRLTATVGTTVQVEEQLVQIETLLSYTVEYAGIDTFRFAVPEAVAEEIQIHSVARKSGPAIKQKSRDEEAKDGWVTWTVVMQQDVIGVQPFRVTYDVSYDAESANGEGDDEKADAESGKKADKPGFVIAPLRALGPDEDQEGDGAGARVTLSSVKGEIVVSKDRALSVTASPPEEELEAIDVRELELLPKTGYLAYRYYKQPVQLTLAKKKHEIQQVVETVISRALVEIVVGHDPMANYRCRYRIKSSERQRLRVDLPRGAELLGILVDRTLIRPEKNDEAQPEPAWDSFFVNVARSKKSDELFWLTIQFRAPVQEFGGNGGRVDLRLPKIGDKQQKSVVVGQLRTAVWVPDEFALVGTPTHFVRELPTRMAGLLGGGMVQYADTNDLEQWIELPSTGMFEFPTQGHVYRYSSLGAARTLEITWWKTVFVSWVLSGTVLFVGWVLARTTWQNRLTWILCVAFVSALLALQSPDWVHHGIAAARLGIVAILALWLIFALSGPQRLHAKTQAAAPTGRPGPGAEAVPPPEVPEHKKPETDDEPKST